MKKVRAEYAVYKRFYVIEKQGRARCFRAANITNAAGFVTRDGSFKYPKSLEMLTEMPPECESFDWESNETYGSWADVPFEPQGKPRSKADVIESGDWVDFGGCLIRVASATDEHILNEDGVRFNVSAVRKVQFREFLSGAEFEPHRTEYLVFLDSHRKWPTGHYGDSTVEVNGFSRTYRELLHECGVKFENGQPFGVPVKVK